MSRLIIKNLPSYVTPARLKDHLLQQNGPGGTLTDVKVAQKQNGTSRQFAFVGFKNDEEAAKVQKWFDRTFIDTTRISVQIVKDGAKNAPMPRPNKKPRLTNFDSNSETAKKQKEHEKKSEGEKDETLNEFMQVMQPRTKERTWANELSGPLVEAQALVKDKQAADVAEGAPLEEGSVEEVDDLEWMRRRMKRGMEESRNEGTYVQSDDEDDSMPTGDADASKPEAKVDKEEESPADTILRTGRLFLRNLSYTCTQSDLEQLFLSFGALNQVHIPIDASSKASKGIAFVKFADRACAVKAFEELDKTSFQGRLLHILPAVERDLGAKAIEFGEKSNVKSEKEKKLKQASAKEFNWAMLYMNADSVASSIADRMNISKADILNPDSADGEGDNTSPAVKLALAETHIIQETKSFLESEGIDLSAFASLESSDRAVRTRRSDTCILVKNIPYGTTADQIRAMFEPHGELNRVVVPPTGTIAVVDFVHADEAAKAFRAVAYRRLGSSVIYLEKAPMGVFSSSTPKAAASANSKPVVIAEDTGGAGDSSEITPGSTLFVKNLAFATTSEQLESKLRHLPGFSFARVKTKSDTKRPTVPGQAPPRLSMGFGFIGFKTTEDARKALKSLSGFVLDGHALSVKFAGRGTEEDKAPTAGEKTTKKGTTTKMVVKNLPFEATKKELYGLFGAHGQLKSVRLPKKFNSRARGFAFLDFATRHEAENAYVALRHTHLLGRHLVLEWAEDEGADVNELRRKAGVGYGEGGELPGKKRKLDLGNGDDEDQEM